MDNAKATEYLQSLLNKKLCIYTTDSRMFYGDFKCTDNESNIILSQSYEYSRPTRDAIKAAVESSSSTSSETPSTETLKVDMTSRFLGLIVVPGQHIIKIEVENP